MMTAKENRLKGERDTALATIDSQRHSLSVYKLQVKEARLEAQRVTKRYLKLCDSYNALSKSKRHRPLTKEELIDKAHSIIDLFEGYLEGKGIKLKNPDKKGNKAKGVEQANIYGSEYYDLEDAVVKILNGGT